MAENDQEKTEDPTPRKRAEAREKGQIARSPDLTAAAMLLASIVALFFLGRHAILGMRISTENLLSGAHAGNLARADDLVAVFHFCIQMVARTTAPLILAIGAVGFLAALSQAGLLLTFKPIEPKLEKINPLTGFKRLVDGRAGMRLVMSLLKVTLVLTVAIWIIVYDLPSLLRLGELEVAPGFLAACELIYALGLKLAAMLLLLAFLDYAYQRHKHEQDLKMTKQEVKQEMKNMEGDPLVKQRRARVARQLAMQRTAAAVPKADVIITNPTHFSIALKYDSATMRAPKVIAKGADMMAFRIRQIAVSHGIPLVERKPLARALYAGVEVGQEVPPEHYAAVAEILAYVYRLTDHAPASAA